MPLPLAYVLTGGIAIGLGVAAYEHREELRELFEDVKFGVQAAIAERQKRKLANGAHEAAPNGSSSREGHGQGERDCDFSDDDLYQTAGSMSTSTLRPEQSDGEFWDSTKSSTSNDGQTSGIYNRKATFRERLRRNRRSATPPVPTISSEENTTGLSSCSSGEETPEDEVLPSYTPANNIDRFLRN